MLEKCLLYIHNNPVESGLVLNAEDYHYCSAGIIVISGGYLKLQELKLSKHMRCKLHE